MCINVHGFCLDSPDSEKAARLYVRSALIKKKRKFSSYIRKFWRDLLQSHVWLTASSHMVKYLRISSYIRKPLLIYDFATDPIWISLYVRRFFFYQCVLEFKVCEMCKHHSPKHSWCEVTVTGHSSEKVKKVNKSYLECKPVCYFLE